MIKQLSLVLLPEEAADQSMQLRKASEQLGITPGEISAIRIRKRSIDARTRTIRFHLTVDVYIGELPVENEREEFLFSRNVRKEKKVLIVGFGPAGMFAALRL